ncbi:glycosyl hydrolase family 18 protein [Cohnella silvisoli]|uniref:Glycosyl hydrolase family 18 protein n=1 Tax=Cohnella silvisoli TaxID=2873699 RepID=A0ABV1L329_9BACL|nr:glycosyl hydrolase family 18 protein [Cohnella silvisoli]
MLLLLFVAAAVAIIWWKASGLPNSSYIKPEYSSKPFPVMVQGKWTNAYAQGNKEGLLIPIAVAQQLVGDGVRYEEKTESIILTTETKVLHFKTGELDATLNRKPFALRFAAKKVDGKLYLPLAPLTELFGVKAEVGESTGIVTLLMPGEAIQHAGVPDANEKGIKLREGSDKSFAIIEDLPAGADLRLWGESDGWYKAQSKSGHIGYVSKGSVTLLSVEQIPESTAPEDSFVAWKGTGKRINLTWEAVYSANPDPNKIGELPGVNVVSPTWFELLDGKGNIRSKADAGYSTWARSKGIQVWGLYSNGFEPDRTHIALASYESRFAMIQQLLAYAKTFKLQGINIDFENVYTKDKDNLVQFMREMTPLLHEQNLVVSIDVTPKSNSEMWSAFLDRERLGTIVDFMMVMAYDEHWASSPVSGSVSSLSWAENSIQRILEEDRVPSSKLILSIPYYTRIWTEEPDGKQGVKVTSKTMDMDAVQQLLKEKKLKPTFSEETGQRYVEFKEGNLVKKIWIEDASSIRARAEIAKKYNLAGIASWRRGFESSDIWGVLDKTLQSRP